ncbi:MAG: sigma 54-interacting transcriptional regulator [Pseudomonadota bacterium]|nr:sigma 54-interacting transcriptional regulator [Pseudomonadota bacterium]
MATILVIDDQDRYVDLCRRAIPEHDYLGPSRSWLEAVAVLKKQRRSIDLVLLDVNFDIPADQLVGLKPGADDKQIARARRRQGLEILVRLRRHLPDLPVVLMTARDDLDIDRAAERLEAEEYTYFLDDENVDARSLRVQIENVLKARRGQDAEGPIFWGRAPPMQRARARLQVLARGRLPVILGGPTGTGKSLLARHYIHPRSGRKGKFVSVDLSTIPRDLVGTTLFGSARGSYTGSVADRKGAFEEADNGTLFLDEIGNLTEEAQKMLLGVLQEGTVTRLGDVLERRVDVKLVVATHEDLGALVRQGRFRRDLYMRLNPACTVTLPSLTERRGDLMRLLGWTARHLAEGAQLRSLIGEYRRRAGLSEEGELVVCTGGDVPEPHPGRLVLLFPDRSVQLLRRHRWPGNLREFAMTIENALTFTFAELVGLLLGGRGDVVQVRPKLLRDLLRAVRVDTPADEVGWKCQVIVRPDGTLNHLAQDVERQYFTKLWEQEEGDFSAMARILMGDPECARKVQLRFNQLGLKVRELKGGNG